MSPGAAESLVICLSIGQSARQLDVSAASITSSISSPSRCSSHSSLSVSILQHQQQHAAVVPSGNTDLEINVRHI